MWGQPGFYSESHANLVYRIRPCLTKQNTHIVQHTNNKNKANSQSQKRKHLPALSPLQDQKERNYKQSTNNVYYIRSHWRKEVSSMGTLPWHCLSEEIEADQVQLFIHPRDHSPQFRATRSLLTISWAVGMSQRCANWASCGHESAQNKGEKDFLKRQTESQKLGENDSFHQTWLPWEQSSKHKNQKYFCVKFNTETFSNI